MSSRLGRAGMSIQRENPGEQSFYSRLLKSIQHHGTLLLLISTICVISLNNSIIKKLTDQDLCTISRRQLSSIEHSHQSLAQSHHDPDGPAGRHMDRRSIDVMMPSPINVFNILAYGNFIAASLMIVCFSSRLYKFKRLTWKHWLYVSLGALLYSALSNSLLLLAFQNTSQNNVSILTRIEPFVIMCLAWYFLGDEIARHKLIGNIAILLGIILMFLWPVLTGGETTFGIGEILAIISALCVSVSTIISKSVLKDVPLGVFVAYRSTLGAILYFIFGCIFEGFDTVTAPWDSSICPDAYWWMIGYGAMTVMSQMMWFLALKSATGTQISFAISFGFPTLLLFAFIVNGEVPSAAQWIGASIIICAIIYVNSVDIRNASQPTDVESQSVYEQLSGEDDTTESNLKPPAFDSERTRRSTLAEFLFGTAAGEEPTLGGMRVM